ncbi:MAG: sigma 54-interacting transcriptional regulator [Rhodospirillales bacterium]|nr:sigma 54-interacting transcriptional regulator [Rhodospirillales bacterium]
MLIAQISDTHIRPKGVLAMGRVDTAGYLARAVAHIDALRPAPDVVLVTGDLVDAGMAEEYAHLRGLLAPLAMPVHLIPGNHDLRGPLRAAFADHRYLQEGDFLQYVVEHGPLRLIALDTLNPRSVLYHLGEVRDHVAFLPDAEVNGQMSKLARAVPYGVYDITNNLGWVSVGTDHDVGVDVRVIAATNRNLERMMEQGQFREDLFHRLNMLSVHLPPLRERVADLKPLAIIF